MSIFDRLQSIEKMQQFFGEYFKENNWSVETVTTDPSLIIRQDGGLSRCGDGRPFEEELPDRERAGYNIFGATQGLAAMIAEDAGSDVVTEDHLREAIRRERKAGIVPGWHNIHGDDIHCGFEGKQAQEGIVGVPNQKFTPAAGVEMLKAVDGKSANVHGDHKENRLTIILKKGHTAISNSNDEQFSVDAEFIHSKLGIRIETIAKHSANVVKTLKPAVNTVRLVI